MIIFPLFSPIKASGPTYVGGTYGTNQTWTPEGSPYIVTSDLIINNCATLTITNLCSDGSIAPVEVRFNPDTGLRVGSGTLYSKSYGILIAKGDRSAPITFTSNLPGNYWKGIDFIWNPSEKCSPPYSSMEYCIVEYGGVEDNYSRRGNISLFCSEVNINHCTIRQSLHDGIYITTGDLNLNCYGKILNSIIKENPECGINIYTGGGSGYCYPLFKGNEISRNGSYGIYCHNKRCNPEIQENNSFLKNGAYPLRIPAFMRLSAGNNFNENGQQMIEVIGTDIQENKTWHNFNLPYRIREKDITVGGSTGSTVTLTIESGCTLKFDPGLGLYLGKGDIYSKSYGVLNAWGAKENPIKFTISVPGEFWSGILFKWPVSGAQSRINYCTIEYGGAPRAQYNNLEGALCFWECFPTESTIINSTICFSKTDGIRINTQGSGSGIIHNCNFYQNSLYDILDYQNTHFINARCNYWGTQQGPSPDLCSSAVVSETVQYAAWLENEFTEPFCFTDASASPQSFNPLTGFTTFNFSLSQKGKWVLSILNQQFEKVWSQSGENSLGGSINWDGRGEQGVVSGRCYYRIEAENDQGSASPVIGILNLGDKSIAKITQPLSHSLYTPGSEISIEGTAITEGGYYELLYGAGEKPSFWQTITGKVYSSKENDQLALWNTTGLSETLYTLRLDVNNHGLIYSDLVGINFLIRETLPPPDSAIVFSYDAQGRLIGVNYPDGSFITYTYDRTGNLLAKRREGQVPPTLIHLVYFKAEPAFKGVLLNWRTASELNTAGFNLYRKVSEAGEYTLINLSLIPAQGSPTTGAEYTYLDSILTESRMCFYLLEEVDTKGNVESFGPISLPILTQSGVFRKSFGANCD